MMSMEGNASWSKGMAHDDREKFGGLLGGIDWFGKIIDGVNGANQDQMSAFIHALSGKLAVANPADKALFRAALGLSDMPKGYEPGTATKLG